MKRLALLLPLLTLTVPAFAQDPATDAVLPAWFDDVRIGMTTNEFLALGLDVKESPRFASSSPGETAYRLESAFPSFADKWCFVFADGRLALSVAESGWRNGPLSHVHKALSAELETRFGNPAETDILPLSLLLDEPDALRTSWTNESRILSVFLSSTFDKTDLTLMSAAPSFAESDRTMSLFFLGLVPDHLSDKAAENVRRFADDEVRRLFETTELGRARNLGFLARSILLRKAGAEIERLQERNSLLADLLAEREQQVMELEKQICRLKDEIEELTCPFRNGAIAAELFATPSPAEETHAENAESAEPEPHAESAEGAEDESHAESAEAAEP